jgi:hypothetical protein
VLLPFFSNYCISYFYSLDVPTSNDPESCAGGSITAGKTSMPERLWVRSQAKTNVNQCTSRLLEFAMGWQPSSTKEIFPIYPSQRKVYLYFHIYNYTKIVCEKNEVAKYEHVNKKINISIKF